MPKAFVSYSWENDDHKKWVKDLAERLRHDGVDVILDQWHLAPGDQLTQFMERSIKENDFVLIICTTNYKIKSDKRAGGVGYEGDIITSEVFTDRNHRKFIPILRQGEWGESAPTWLQGKFYIDLRGNTYSENCYNDLLTTIHNLRPKAPPIGQVPVERYQVEDASRVESLSNGGNIMGELHNLNVGCADTSIIISNNATFLIDCHNISDYVYLLPANKVIRGLFITHQHYDHFDGMKYLRDNRYQIQNLIHCPYKRRNNDTSVTLEEWNEFNSHVNFFKNLGTQVYTPYRQDSFVDPYWNTNGLEYRIIGPFKDISDAITRELHDACLVIHVKMGHRACLFAGDASDTSLQKISSNTNNYCNDILHASHHGSINGANLDFIKNSNAAYTVVSTQSGVYDSVPHPTALQRYTNHTIHKVYRTDIDGSIKWTF